MNGGEEARRRSIGQQAATAIWLERVLVVWWKSAVNCVLLAGLISLAICPIGTCSARPVILDRRAITMISREQWDKYGLAAESAAYDDELQKYLSDFGYLPQNNPEISNLRSDIAVKGAIARLQEYAGLNVTATLDEPTKRLLKAKRCGREDLRYDDGDERRSRFKRYTLVSGNGWKSLRLTFKVVNWPWQMGQGETRRAVHDAFKLWSEASALEFVETNDDKADILIEFARGDHSDGYPFDGKNVVLAHAFFPGEGRGGDAHFDLDEVWTHLPPSATDYEKVNFFTVAAHEFGHSLGLGHSKDRNALMFAYYKDYSKLTALPYDDAMAIQKVYGVGKNGIPEPPPSTTEAPETDPPTYATYAPPASPTTPIPDVCHSRIDAVSRIRNEIFVFKGKYFWRYNDSGSITSDPTLISRFWHGFPEDLDGVDAVSQRPKTDTILFFKGRDYWEFSANYMLPGYPKDIATLDLASDVQKIDAAFIWSWTSKVYLLSGKSYWRLNDEEMKVEHDYPRELAKHYWKGVPANVDAAFTDSHGVTHFFKDSDVYKFDNAFEEVRRKPIKISEFWHQCRAISKSSQLPYLREESSSAWKVTTWWGPGALLLALVGLML